MVGAELTAPQPLKRLSQVSAEQAAACLGISLSTADRAWRYARAWLHAAMPGAGPAEKIDPA